MTTAADNDTKPRHAGQVIVDSLALHGVKRVFSVPGASFLAVLDGLYGADMYSPISGWIRHSPVSSRRSSHRTRGFPASGARS
jgi:hypothetical protein